MLQGTLYIAISQAVLVVTGLFLQFFLGRTLGPELYGVYGVINAFLMINDLILMKGVFDTVSKFVAEKEEAAGSLISSVAGKMTIIGALAGFLYFFSAGYIAELMNDPELTGYLELFAFIIPFSAISTVYIGALNGLRQFKKQSAVFILYYIVRLIAVVVFVFMGFSVKGVIFGLLLADILRLIIARGFYRPTGEVKYTEGWKIFRFSVQLVMISLLSALIMHIDLLAVKALLGSNFKTGLYTSAMTLAKVPAFMIIPVTITLLPVISKTMSEGDMELTEKRIRQALKLLLIIVLPATMFILAASENCIRLFFGSEYIQASDTLRILLLGGVFISIKVLMYSIMVAVSRPGYVVSIGIVSLMIEVLLLYFLLNRIGFVGAAVASALTHLAGFIVSYIYVARRYMTHMFPLFVIKITLASLTVYAAASFYSPADISLVLYYFLLTGLFFLLLICLGEISPSEIRRKIAEKRAVLK